MIMTMTAQNWVAHAETDPFPFPFFLPLSLPCGVAWLRLSAVLLPPGIPPPASMLLEGPPPSLWSPPPAGDPSPAATKIRRRPAVAAWGSTHEEASGLTLRWQGRHRMASIVAGAVLTSCFWHSALLSLSRYKLVRYGRVRIVQNGRVARCITQSLNPLPWRLRIMADDDCQPGEPLEEVRQSGQRRSPILAARCRHRWIKALRLRIGMYRERRHQQGPRQIISSALRTASFRLGSPARSWHS